ncbi:MAG: hydroxyethylthiazole kinase, partial [candidate division WOR-3 bacterium]
NGHPLMSRVTGLGCILTALIGAFTAVEKDPLVATVGAVALLGLAGEKAAEQAKGPGTFKTALFDVLFALSPEEMERGVKVREETVGG